MCGFFCKNVPLLLTIVVKIVELFIIFSYSQDMTEPSDTLRYEDELIERLYSEIDRITPSGGVNVLLAERSLLKSCWQKSIRRGRRQEAIGSALGLFHLSPDYVWRRLRVIALEDVGVANLPLVASVLAVGGRAVARRKFGEEKLLAGVSALLSASHKSRTACDLLSLAMASPEIDAFRGALGRRPPRDWARAVNNVELPWWQRVACLQLIHGNSEDVDGQRRRLTAHQPDALDQILDYLGVPESLRYSARKGRSTYGLNTTLILAHVICRNREQTISNDSISVESEQCVRGVPAYAFCMYTKAGRAANRLFMESDTAARETLRRSGAKKASTAFGYALFQVEGAALAGRVSSVSASEVQRQADAQELLSFGIHSEHHEELRQLAASGIGRLNAFRLRVGASQANTLPLFTAQP